MEPPAAKEVSGLLRLVCSCRLRGCEVAGHTRHRLPAPPSASMDPLVSVVKSLTIKAGCQVFYVVLSHRDESFSTCAKSTQMITTHNDQQGNEVESNVLSTIAAIAANDQTMDIQYLRPL